MEPTTRPVAPRDLAALIGLLAIVEGHLMAGDLDPHLAEHLRGRWVREGLVPDGGDERALRQAVDDLDHRLRFALGEHDEHPVP